MGNPHTRKEMKPDPSIVSYNYLDEMNQPCSIWKGVSGYWYQSVKGDGVPIQYFYSKDRGGPYTEIMRGVNHGGPRANAGNPKGTNQYTNAKQELEKFGNLTPETLYSVRKRKPNSKKRSDAGKKRVKSDNSDRLYNEAIQAVISNVVNDPLEIERLQRIEDAKADRNSEWFKQLQKEKLAEKNAKYRRRYAKDIKLKRSSDEFRQREADRVRNKRYEAKRRQLPADLICPCCFAERTAMKQWTKTLLGWICRSCATLVDGIDNIVALQQLVFKRNQERLQG